MLILKIVIFLSILIKSIKTLQILSLLLLLLYLLIIKSREFLFELAICHTVLTEEKNGEIIYNASSPDELALLNFARFVGCEY